MKTKYLLYTGIVIPVIFWVTTFICGLIQGDYNHLTRMVSELGSIETTSQYTFTAGLLLCSILSISFVVGLFRTCKEMRISVIPIVIILSFSISIAGAAIFPLPLRLHLYMGMPSILLIFSPLLGLILWNSKGYLSALGIMSIISFVIMALGFLTYFPDILNMEIGLKQRFFHVGWSVWFIYLSYSFTRPLEYRKVLITT
jgi:hypothetical membrane protein